MAPARHRCIRSSLQIWLTLRPQPTATAICWALVTKNNIWVFTHLLVGEICIVTHEMASYPPHGVTSFFHPTSDSVQNVLCPTLVHLGGQLPGSKCLCSGRCWRATAWTWPWRRTLRILDTKHLLQSHSSTGLQNPRFLRFIALSFELLSFERQ